MHFFSTDQQGRINPPEPQSVLQQGYGLEGISCFVFSPSNPQPTRTIPFYRWQDPAKNMWFYTTDPNGERAPASGYQPQGVAAFVFRDQDDAEHAVPLFRWNHDVHGHFYTTDPNGEIAAASGFRREGIACYVLAYKEPGTTEFYRFLSHER